MHQLSAGIEVRRDTLAFHPVRRNLLDGRYQLLERIGEGGMGSVFSAENVRIGRPVAIKILHPRFVDVSDVLERFRREARMAAFLRHPNVVEILDMGETEEGAPYIVMEHLEGQSLHDRLTEDEGVDQDEALSIVAQVLWALEAAHAAGVVHRDLKPDNIFLVPGRSGTTVKVLDFGVAKYLVPGLGQRTLQEEGVILGTPAYMSPEQALGRADLDERSDLYTTGVLLYELLCGRRPHASASSVPAALLLGEPAPLSTTAPWVPAPLADIVDRAIARDPDHRYQSATDLLAALEPFLPSGARCPPVVGPAHGLGPGVRGAPGRCASLQPTTVRVRHPGRAWPAIVVAALALACVAWVPRHDRRIPDLVADEVPAIVPGISSRQGRDRRSVGRRLASPRLAGRWVSSR